MKKIIFLLAVCAAGYFAWQKISHNASDGSLEPLYKRPYVVVYGRDRCGLTQKCQKSLREEDLSFVYENIDKKEVADELHARMQEAGLDTRSYGLPVVDVNGRIFIRPTLEKILDAYDNYQEE